MSRILNGHLTLASLGLLAAAAPFDRAAATPGDAPAISPAARWLQFVPPQRLGSEAGEDRQARHAEARPEDREARRAHARFLHEKQSHPSGSERLGEPAHHEARGGPGPQIRRPERVAGCQGGLPEPVTLRAGAAERPEGRRNGLRGRLEAIGVASPVQATPRKYKYLWGSRAASLPW
ncbi:MAG: hypothetical protein QOK01_26 [Alphaproteobacteria bacterium]|nr:hypothetical protein [Alphaproteobacteria bacterium]